MTKVHNTPSDVSADEGEVHVDGPGGAISSMTPDAAAETSDRLLRGAVEAQGQRTLAEGVQEEKDRKQ